MKFLVIGTNVVFSRHELGFISALNMLRKVTSEIVQYLHPELRHGEHVYVSSWDRIVMDSIKVLNDDYILENLAHGAQKAYNKYFSTLTNIRTISKSSIL